ncbi:hypothetical protein CBS101457_002110 [Exobasidium rhododendri]|nr:hypothetical protein CBS101457_002110 [Exobasidium rhododendri]
MPSKTPSFASSSTSSIYSVRTPKNRPVRRSSSHFSLLSPRNLLEGSRYDEVEEQLNPLLTEIFVNEDDVNAFSEALQDDAGQQDPSAAAASSSLPVLNALSKLGHSSNTAKSQERSDSTINNSANKNNDPRKEVQENSSDPDAKLTLTRPNNPRKIGRIAAASDFAPIRERTQRRRRKTVDSGNREGFLYVLLRFPLLLLIFLTITLEFTAYVLIRQIVNVIEYAIAWRGKKGKLRSRLRKAKDATEWRNVALELDEYLGYEGWKMEDASGLYDWILVKKVANSLRQMREKEDADGVMGVLELCLRNNFAGTENFRLYSETFFGTKYLIESYLSEVEEALEYVRQTERVSPQKKRSFYRGVQKNMGRSALCLSGGGSFGYYHVGLVKALLDSNLLPSIITGTSAGGLIAALACTRTNEELKGMLVPELADRITACEESMLIWAPRAYRTGARFDTVKWAEKAQFFTRGSMTFAEAYAKTGKVLNISVIPADRHSPVKLLNYHTAPNCIIWSSLLASAAVPGIMNPVCLMQKDKDGKAVPWNWGHRFKDGSLRVDIPLQDLHSLFNVNYPIVSQVNPHVHLFFFAPKGMPGRPVAHRKGKGWRGGFFLSASEHVLKLHLSMNFKIIRDLDLLPSLLGQDWSGVFLQNFAGSVTIWPKTRAWDWVRILSDPDRKELARMIKVGLSVTFPKLHMIENRVRLERAIESGRKSTRQALRALQSHETGTTNNGVANHKDSDRAIEEGNDSQIDTALPTASLYPTPGGVASQSDTDGTNDDFFSIRKSTSSSINKASSSSSSATTKAGSVKLRAQLRRLQGLRGMSSMHESEAGGYESTQGDDLGGTATPVTPGELPRHIRARSMGLDDDDDDEDVQRIRHEGLLEGGAEEGERGNDDKAKMSSTSKRKAGGYSNWPGENAPYSMRWLNDRDKPEESSGSSSDEVA